MKIPTTKDGKHKLIFPQDFAPNHGLRLRSALEGRVVHELLSLASSDQINDLEGVYAFNFHQKYPENDPLGIFKIVSVPITGKISTAQKIDPKDKWVSYEGDGFSEPYIPLTFLSETLYVFTPLDVDSFNMFDRGSFNFREMVALVPEIDRFGDFPERYRTYKRQLEKVLEKECNGALKRVIKNKEATNFLRNLSKFYVLNALYHSKKLLTNPEPRASGFRNISRESNMGQTHASIKLQEKICKSAVGLCLEYLQEMVT